MQYIFAEVCLVRSTPAQPGDLQEAQSGQENVMNVNVFMEINGVL